MPRVIGHNMVGAEIFVSSLPEEITAESLQDAVAASMGVEKASLTLLCNGMTLEPHELPICR